MKNNKCIYFLMSLAVLCASFGISAHAEGEKSLCDKYGAALPKVIDDFVAKTAPNPKVDFFRSGKFKDADVPKLKEHLVNFVSDAIGCPGKKYKGRSMKAIHKGNNKNKSMKITAAEFSAIAADLQAVLEQDGVTPEDVKTIMAVVGGTAKDIIDVK